MRYLTCLKLLVGIQLKLLVSVNLNIESRLNILEPPAPPGPGPPAPPGPGGDGGGQGVICPTDGSYKGTDSYKTRDVKPAPAPLR